MKTLLALILASQITFGNEAFYNDKMAACLKGKRETRLFLRERSFVFVDIETSTHLIEAGLDKRSSLDSVQQAILFHILKPSKKPMIIIYDRDNKEGVFEYRIRLVSERLGIPYRRISVSLLNKNRCPD